MREILFRRQSRDCVILYLRRRSLLAETEREGAVRLDFLLELEEAVEEGLGRRGAARHVDVDGDDSIAAADDRVGVVVVAASILLERYKKTITYPPPLAQEPMDRTKRGSGIWS